MPVRQSWTSLEAMSHWPDGRRKAGPVQNDHGVALAHAASSKRSSNQEHWLHDVTGVPALVAMWSGEVR